MKEFKITGGFNSGLKVYSDNELIMFSEVENKWFKPDFINVFDKQKNLLISIKQISQLFKTKYRIENTETKNHIEKIENGFLKLKNGNAIKFKVSLTSIITNPYLRVYHEDVEIGKLNNKKMGLELNYKFFIEKEHEKLWHYILIYILITESNKDYD